MSCKVGTTVRAFEDAATAAFFPRKINDFALREAVASVNKDGVKQRQVMMQTPCSDYKETKGLIYFARMLDKIRLKAARRLPEDYLTGVEDPTFFDARARFLGIGYEELATRTLQGGSDEEILEWCFKRGRRPSEEEIEIWTAFIAKRGWRDAGSVDLQAAKERAGWSDRHEIQTWVDLHDVEEGRRPEGRFPA